MEKTKSSICVETHRNEVILTITQGIDITAAITLSSKDAVTVGNHVVSAARLIKEEYPMFNSNKTLKIMLEYKGD